VLGVCLTLAALTLALPAGAATTPLAGATTTHKGASTAAPGGATAQAGPTLPPGVIRFQPESFQAFEKQLRAREIHAVTFNKVAHTMHLSLNDHRHMLVSYPPTEEPQLAAKLEAKGIPVLVEHHRKKVVTVHHTLRYVAAGILAVIVVGVFVVLLLGRRRDLAGETDEASSEQAADDAPTETDTST